MRLNRPPVFTHPQEVTRIEKLIPQVVEEVKPNEKEDVDAHPDHLQRYFKKDFLLKMQNRLEAFYAQTLCVKPQLLRFEKSHSWSEELTSMKVVRPWLIIQLPMFRTSIRRVSASSGSLQTLLSALLRTPPTSPQVRYRLRWLKRVNGEVSAQERLSNNCWEVRVETRCNEEVLVAQYWQFFHLKQIYDERQAAVVDLHEGNECVKITLFTFQVKQQ